MISAVFQRNVGVCAAEDMNMERAMSVELLLIVNASYKILISE